MVHRYLFPELKYAVSKFPVVCITGPRQCGKTTLARFYCSESGKIHIYLDLEKSDDFRRFSDPGLLFNDNREKLIVIYEIQRSPEIFPELRAEIDADRRPGRFLILGSAGPDIINRSSETLAGRIRYINLHPFIINEIHDRIKLNDLFFWGGYPEVVLGNDDRFRKDWLDSFITTYLERNLPMIGLKASPVQIRRLWEMLAYHAANLLNSSTLALSLGISNHTTNTYLDYLEGAWMIYRIAPFDFNTGKRIVKSKKIFISDNGLLHRLLRIESYDQLMGNPIAGHSWENFVFTQIFHLVGNKWNVCFYRTHSGQESDLVLCKGPVPEICVEIKLSSAPSLTKSFISSIAELGTKRNFIIIPYGNSYRLREDIFVCNLGDFAELIISDFK